MNGQPPSDPIFRLDEQLAMLAWPELKEIYVPDLRKDDCLLVCAGFEDRCLAVLERAHAAEKQGFSIGVVRYLPSYSDNKIDQIMKLANELCPTIRQFTYDREKPAGFAHFIGNFTRNFSRIFVDISGMSRLLIIQLLSELMVRRKYQVRLIYGEAKFYPPSEEIVNRNIEEERLSVSYLSSGIFEIAATPELASVAMLGEPIRLIAFPSFDPAQLTNLVQELQPTYGEFIHGVPPDMSNEWRTNAIRQINNRSISDFSAQNHHCVSTLDYRETIDVILSIYADRSVYDRLVIAPTGSKMQTVGIALLRAVLDDIQIVYPTPQTFIAPTEHTVGLRRLFELDIPIAELAKAAMI